MNIYIIVLTNRVLITVSKQLETDNRDQKVPLKRVELRSLEGSATLAVVIKIDLPSAYCYNNY